MARRTNSLSEKIIPTTKQLNAGRSKLPIYGPLDLRDLVNKAKARGGEDVDAAFTLEYKKAIKDRASALLKLLVVDHSHPEAWYIGFVLLATYFRGLAQLRWKPKPTNRNAARWMPDHDLNLIREVTILKAKGLSERKAISTIAADKTKGKLLPYR